MPATAAAAVAIMTAAARAGAGIVVAARRGLVGGGNAGGDDLAEQRLVLQRVEIAGDGIAARGLPALDHRAGVVVELAGRLGVEAESGEAALHVAALAAVEADLVLGGLVGVLGEGIRVDAGRQVPRR